jgi:hypothetical protein
MKRAAIILLVIMLALTLIAASCDPDPGDGWTPTDGSPMDNANATATYGAEQWHAQLTEIAEEETQP